jgi:hypothetical protein
MPRPRRRKVTRDEWGSITRTEADDARVRIRASILGGTRRPTRTADSPMLVEDLSLRTVALYRRMFDRLVRCRGPAPLGTPTQ